MLKRISLVALFVCSIAHAFSMSPPTVLQSWSDPLTLNAVSSSVTINTGGIQRLKLSEAPGSSADVYVSFYQEDGTTEIQSVAFTNSDSTADVDVQVNVLSKKAVINIYPRVTQTYTAVVYGSHGGDTNATQTNASLLTTGTLSEQQLGSYVVTQNYSQPVTINGNTNVEGEIFSDNTYASVYRANQGNIPNATDTVVTFDTELNDANGIFNNPTFNITVAGTYLISTKVLFDTNATNRRVIKINVNGSDISESGQPGVSSANGNNLFTTFIKPLSAGDAVTVIVYQDSGSDLDLEGGQTFTYCNVVRLF